MDISTPGARAAKIAIGGLVGTALVVGIVEHSATRQSVSAELKHATSPASEWTAAWGAAVQPPVDGDEDSGPNWSRKGFADQSVRQVVRSGAGGSKVRIRVSNAYGTKPLRIAGATVGRSAGGAMMWPGTARAVTFGGGKAGGTAGGAAVVPAGRELVSDPVPFTTSPLEKLAVTLRFKEPTGPATFHRFGMGTASYRASGDHLKDEGADAFRESNGSWYYLSGVEVAGAAAGTGGQSGQGAGGRGTVVAFGDSLVDGVGSTPEADSRFTDDLGERLAAAHRPYGVVNAGIGSNKLLNSSACGGEKALDRFRRDVLDRPGVRSVIVHLGANDIGAPQVEDPCVHPNPKVTARQLIDGHRRLVRAAHARGIRVIGMTVLPMKGARFPLWNPQAEQLRQALNLWIRTGRAYDAVVDADRVLSDPADRPMPRPGYVFMDGLHPNDAGYHAIAGAIDLSDL
ncbi:MULTISPECIES: SGNH/GDSL hydrolase family protein [Actinomadura]|uniref:SGNH/GDSL hydrolase family protein n=1 Tax=Actinomadura yumaensis TaxID=111807 RepID=A0ABW2CQ69_9ACTN|nr:SGNH/GDSL hydrolase family protein [Actinomadura sp. J1-007]MWK35239.1 SGNH/GDSL hydrolase family protein [Actinomadura sp. J1-007]